MENEFTEMEIADMSNEELTAINKERQVESYHVDGSVVEGYTEVELDFTDEEYKNLVESAKILGMSPNEYINYALERAVARHVEIQKEINNEIEVLDPE